MTYSERINKEVREDRKTTLCPATGNEVDDGYCDGKCTDCTWMKNTPTQNTEKE